MKILIIHNHYQQPGGEQVAVEEQVYLLRERDHEVILYTRDNAEIERYGFWQKCTFRSNRTVKRSMPHSGRGKTQVKIL